LNQIRSGHLSRSHSHYKDFLDLRGDGRVVLYKRADHQNPKWTVRLKIPNTSGFVVKSARTTNDNEARRFAEDDVINVAGLKNNAKERGEDLRTGRITLPVVHFLRAAAPAQRQDLLAEFRSATTDAPTHHRLLDSLAGSGVLDLCRTRARHAVRSELETLGRIFPPAHLQTLDQFATLVIEDYY